MKKGQINIAYKGRRIAFNGQDKLVGQASRYSTIAYDAIVAYAAKAAAVPESSIDMSMDAIFDALNYFVLNGHSVQIPNLGTFSISVRVKSSESEAEFTNNFERNLRGVSIHFLPDPELKSMIASTAISTSVDDEGYESAGVIAVTSALFGANNVLYPMNAGRPYELEPLTRIVMNGSRLSAKYLPATALKLTFIDSAGAEHTSSFGGQYISQSYNALVVNLKRIAENYPSYVAIKKVEVSDNDNTYFSKEFAAPVEDTPAISAVCINGKPLAENGTYPFKPGETVEIRMLVSQSTFVDEVKVADVDITPSQVGEGKLTLSYTPLASGNAPISVKAASTAANVYNISFGEAGGVSIVSVTANGDPLNNGSTTNITAGSDYNVQIAGAGLGDLTAENFVLPQGTTITITSQSATLINATIGNAQAGDFKVIVNDEEIFSAALVAVTPGVSVTGWKLGANGATQSIATSVDADVDTGGFGIFLVGTDIDELSTSDFSGQGISGISYTPATGELEGIVDAGTRTLVIQSEGTTIATLTIIKASAGGDDGFDKD